jgi:EAL domain-containing protein (putative c-di-GMP-specific phosphodiesterase class I)
MSDPEPSAPSPTPPSAPEALPSWARLQPAAVPGARWLAAARRLWAAAEAPPAPAGDGEPDAGPPRRAARGGAAARERPAAAAPDALLERLRRCVAHAVRHPGFGFAVLRVQRCDAPPPGPRAGGADLGRQAERRLQLALRPGDALAALPPPAGFAAVLDGVADEADLRAIVQRLQAELAEPFLDGYEPLKPAWRIGVVFCAPGQPPRPAERLLQRAEQALAGAEPGGWTLASPPEERPDARRLQQALAAPGLQLGFEPQVDLARGTVTALGAWLAAREAPARVLAAADAGDDDGLAAALLQRQLALAAGPFVQWRTADASRRGCRLALPVAASLVRRAGWADELAALLHDTGLEGSDVQLELPATQPLHDRNLPSRLQGLVRQGVALALDDFGTGHSSLSSLGRLPLALLKIHASFVPQAHEREHHRVLLESTVRLAAHLGIATLAKGVETPQQRTLLHGLGCQRGEGGAARALLAPQALAGLPAAA